MSDNSFVSRNKYVLGLVGAAAVVGTGYYVYSQQSTSIAKPKGDKDKEVKEVKKEKKKKTEVKEDKLYPTKEGLPAIDSSVVASLSDSEKEQWALALKEDGNKEFKAQKYDKAIKYYTAALEINKDPIFYSNRSACYAAINDHENVILDTSEAIKLKPDYTKCVLRRATSYEILEQYENAMFDLTALTIYGGFSNKSIESVLERVLRKHSIKIVENSPKLLQLPSAATIGSFFGAFFEELNPENISENSLTGAKLIYQALQDLNKNTQIGYDNAYSNIDKALSELNIEELNKSSENSAIAAIALEYSAAFKFLKNDPKSAATDIEKALALKPRPRSYVLRALINADKSSYDEALLDFKKAEEMDPKCSDIYYHLGQLYYLTGDLKNAEINFTKAKELNPKNVYAYIQLACITYKNGSSSKANDKFTEAKLKFPTAPEIPNYYGEILADSNDIKGACLEFDIAARLQEVLPTFTVGALPLINKATCISRESYERIDEAEELLIKACKLDPKSELARVSLAQIKLQKDQVDEAIELFEESSKLARSFDEKVQATSFAEATKMQKRIKNDPVLTAKIAEVMRESGNF